MRRKRSAQSEPEHALAFLVRFVDVDVASMHARERRVWCLDVQRFATDAMPTPFPLVALSGGPPSDQQLRELQQLTRRAVSAAAAGPVRVQFPKEFTRNGLRELGLRALGDTHKVQIATVAARVAAVGLQLEISSKGVTPAPIVFRGGVCDLFVLRLGLELGAAADRLRRCPECTTFFVRAGKRLYCSDRCQGHAATRRYLKKHQRRVRKQRRARYEEAVQRKTGSLAVKVGRRKVRRRRGRHQ